MIPQLEGKGRIHIETQASMGKIYYVVNFVTDEGLIVCGKRLETENGADPLLTLKYLHKLIYEVEQVYIEHQLCLKPL